MPLLIQLFKHDDEFVLNMVTNALGEIGPEAKAAVPQIVARLGSKNSYARQHAARALGRIGPNASEAVATLQKLLVDEDTGVRVWAAFALARITGDSKDHVSLLIELWKKDQSDGLALFVSVRCEVAQALELLGPEARPARDILLEGLLDDKAASNTHLYAARTLGNLHEDAEVIVPKLVELLERKAEGDLRIRNCLHAAEALGTLGPKAKAAIPYLRRLLDDEENEIVDAAVRALERITVKD